MYGLEYDYSLLIIALAFLGGGLMKGVLGIGLPLIAVPVSATVIAPATAISLTVIPIMLTNVWQVSESGYLRCALRRYWLVIAALVLTTLLAGRLLVSLDEHTSSLFMGLVLIAFCILQMLPWRFNISRSQQIWVGPLVGMVSGLIGGLSGLYGSIIVAYLLALRLPKDEFIGTIALFYLFGSGTLYLVLARYSVLATPELIISALAVAPALLGLLIGRGVRKYLSQQTFRRAIVALLLAVGIALCIKSLS